MLIAVLIQTITVLEIDASLKDEMPECLYVLSGGLLHKIDVEFVIVKRRLSLKINLIR